MKKIMMCIMICLIFGLSFVTVNADTLTSNGINIAVDEEIDDIDIATLNDYSKSVDYIWTCIYDRLLEYDNSGEITYSLAESIRFIPDPNAVYSPINLNDYNLEDVIDDMYEHGWEDFYDVLDIENLNSSNDFLNWIGVTYLEITLRSDVYYHDGTLFDAYELYDYIQYVKNRTNNSRSYRQWLPVYSMNVDASDNFKIVFELNFTNLNYGLIEFLYSLSSPISSIGRINDGENLFIGTGAYIFEESDESTYVQLSKNNNWWGNNSSSTSTLRFIYDNQLDPTNLDNGYDIEIISSDCFASTLYDESNIIDPSFQIANNPIILKSNHYENSDNFLISFISQSCFYNSSTSIVLDEYVNSLMKDSYDYWAYTNKFNGQQTIFNNQIVTVACRNTTTVSYVSFIMKNLFESNNSNMSLNRNILSDDFFDQRNEQIYDLYIDEVEVEAINSVMRYLDQTNNANELSLMQLLKRCGTFESYKYVMANVQKSLLLNDSIAYLGWTYKNIYVNNQQLNIGGQISPTGFCPYGDASRIDLRFIS